MTTSATTTSVPTVTGEVLHAGEGESFPVLTDTITVKHEAHATPYRLYEVRGPRDSGPPPHEHPWAETFYVLDGELDVVVGTETAHVGPGAVVHFPAHTIHTFAITTEDARFLAVTEGEGAGRLFRQLATLGPVVPDEEHLPAIVGIAMANGLSSPLFAG